MRQTTPVCELANPRLVYFIWNGDVVEELVDIGGSVALHCGQVVEGEEEQILRPHSIHDFFSSGAIELPNEGFDPEDWRGSLRDIWGMPQRSRRKGV